jgi:hypothetical protein
MFDLSKTGYMHHWENDRCLAIVAGLREYVVLWRVT